jgi:hypothetical protein
MLIYAIHLGLVLFLTAAPFFGSEYFLSLHFLIVPFILFHWITNQSVCALTEMEKLLRGTKDDDETFIGKIMKPIYKFKSIDEEAIFLYVAMIFLWMITFIKLQPTGFAWLKSEFAAFIPHPRTPPPP